MDGIAISVRGASEKQQISPLSPYSIHPEPVKLDLSVELARVEILVAGYFPKFAGIAKWRQSAVANARAKKQVDHISMKRVKSSEENLYAKLSGREREYSR
ncbi:MAG: hypothetical protein ABSH41_07540 [Syntrophobacteraceae bacterium]|jgi:hypothetical protein